MQMIDVVQKLREIASRSPEEIGRAIAAAEQMSGVAVTEEMTEKQKKYFGGGKKDDDKESGDKKASKSEKPDFADIDKDGDKEESMKKAAKDKEDKKVDEDVQITLTGSDAVLAEILKLAGQIGAKTSGGPSSPAPSLGGPTPSLGGPAPIPPKPMGMPPTGPIPSLDKMMGGGDHEPDMGMEDEVIGDSYDASTTPSEHVMDADAAFPAGNDLNKPKMTAPKVAPGDNPLHRAISFD